MLLPRFLYVLRGHGQHRAADYIPIVEAESDRWQQLAELRETALGHADKLLERVGEDLASAKAEVAQLTAELDTLTEAHDLLQDAHHELCTQLIELRAENDNLRATYSPAPADNAPAIPIRPYDPEATDELAVSTLWDGINSIRVADVRSLTVLNKQTKAAA